MQRVGSRSNQGRPHVRREVRCSWPQRQLAMAKASAKNATVLSAMRPRRVRLCGERRVRVCTSVGPSKSALAAMPG